LWPILKRSDVILADRGFCDYADYWCLLQQGIDSVMRLHQRRKARYKSQFEGAKGLDILLLMGGGVLQIHLKN
jgi:hypothetical protein